MSLLSEHVCRPFHVEHHRTMDHGDGDARFTPHARLFVTAMLRTSGLLAGLSDSQARTLLAILTYLSANGWLHASRQDIAGALGVSEREASQRLTALVDAQHAGKPVVINVQRDQSSDVVALSPHLLSQEEIVSAPHVDSANPHPPVAGREAVIAYSRLHYARPREEVERMIAAQLGHLPDGDLDEEQQQAWQQLDALGVPKNEINSLIASYPLGRILRQLSWLPARHATWPDRLIVAAIKGDYAAPPVWQAVSSSKEPDEQSGPATAGSLRASNG